MTVSSTGSSVTWSKEKSNPAYDTYTDLTAPRVVFRADATDDSRDNDVHTPFACTASTLRPVTAAG